MVQITVLDTFVFLVVFVKPIHVTAHNTSSSSLMVSWSEPEELTHGIFCGVEIFYRLNGASQRLSAAVASGIREYELTNLLPYTVYGISVKPYTLEGEGKESEEVLARTGGGGRLLKQIWHSLSLKTLSLFPDNHAVLNVLQSVMWHYKDFRVNLTIIPQACVGYEMVDR